MNDLFTTDFSFLGAVDVAKQFTAVPGGQPRAAGKLRTVNGIEYSLTRSEQTRAKISASQKGKTVSEEQRAKLRAINLGHSVSAETRAKIGAAGRGRKCSPEECAKRSARLKGHSVSAETRAKIGAANKGRKYSPEECAKRSASLKGLNQNNSFAGKTIMTPTGKFDSKQQAAQWAQANGLNKSIRTIGAMINTWLVTHPDQFYYIPKDTK